MASCSALEAADRLEAALEYREATKSRIEATSQGRESQTPYKPVEELLYKSADQLEKVLASGVRGDHDSVFKVAAKQAGEIALAGLRKFA